jgi:hypothetical protein
MVGGNGGGGLQCRSQPAALRAAREDLSQRVSGKDHVFVPLAAIAGTFIIIAVIVAIVLAVAFGYYTYSGSAINAHPNDGLDGAPGASDPSEASGKGRTGDDPDDPFSPGGGLGTHGTR